MKIVHRITVNIDARTAELLARCGVQPPSNGVFSFEIAEDDPRWPSLGTALTALDAVDLVWTKPTQQEVAAASHLLMEGQWQYGYPMPDNDAGYLSVTYDLARYCAVCGCGAVQMAPFRMVREPKWGSRGVLQLNWVFDEFFVRPDVWEAVFRPFGVEAGVVLAHKSGRKLESVVQLLPPIADAQLTIPGSTNSTCGACGQRKYTPWTRGCFPAFRTPQQGAMVRTREYFGSGARCYRGVVVSKNVRQRLHKMTIRGCSFLPMCE